jgi:hypothetical protein
MVAQGFRATRGVSPRCSRFSGVQQLIATGSPPPILTAQRRDTQPPRESPKLGLSALPSRCPHLQVFTV